MVWLQINIPLYCSSKGGKLLTFQYRFSKCCLLWPFHPKNYFQNPERVSWKQFKTQLEYTPCFLDPSAQWPAWSSHLCHKVLRYVLSIKSEENDLVSLCLIRSGLTICYVCNLDLKTVQSLFCLRENLRHERLTQDSFIKESSYMFHSHIVTRKG